MPDSPIEPVGPYHYDPYMEARIARLEVKFDEMKSILVRLDASLAATLPHLATKADLAEKPGKAYLWGVLSVLLAAYAAGLAAVAVLH